MNGKLPDGWKWTTIKECSTVVTGRTPSKKDTNNYGDFMPFVKPPELLNSSIFSAGDNISEKGAKEARVLPVNSVLVSCIGNLGKTGMNRVPVAFNQQINAVIFPQDIVPEYGFYYFQSSEFKKLLEGISSATTVTIVNKSKFESLPFPLAPLPEQERIVGRIESLFTRLDAGVAGLKRAQAALKRYRTSVLKAACEGRLMTQEESDESANELLKEILIKRRKPTASPDITDLPELPNSWVWATIEQLSDANRSITYGVVKLGDDLEDGIPTLRSSNVRHLKIETNVIKKISPEIANRYKRTKLQGGELLVTVRGTLGGVAVVPAELEGFNISREVAMIAFVDKRIAPISQYFIASKPLQNWLSKRTRGIAYTGINIETLKQLPIPLPPLGEQHRIVAEVERRLSVVQEVEAVVQANLARAARLRQAILKRAFEGRLS